ncbi:hypothetical protein T492DRAFT_1150556 [Pavlovales sp. CCMP2436]|nr:hypothetical protein T492DRAFT_1150556 [Pavlovales sp. CCMP2436]
MRLLLSCPPPSPLAAALGRAVHGAVAGRESPRLPRPRARPPRRDRRLATRAALGRFRSLRRHLRAPRGPWAGPRVPRVTVDVSDNELTDLSPLAACLNLRTLNGAFNRVVALACLGALSGCRGLRVLQLNDNPVAAHAHYRPLLLLLFPALTELDGEPVLAAAHAHAHAPAAAAAARAASAAEVLAQDLALLRRLTLAGAPGGRWAAACAVVGDALAPDPEAFEPDPAGGGEAGGGAARAPWRARALARLCEVQAAERVQLLGAHRRAAKRLRGAPAELARRRGTHDGEARALGARHGAQLRYAAPGARPHAGGAPFLFGLPAGAEGAALPGGGGLVRFADGFAAEGRAAAVLGRAARAALARARVRRAAAARRAARALQAAVRGRAARRLTAGARAALASARGARAAALHVRATALQAAWRGRRLRVRMRAALAAARRRSGDSDSDFDYDEQVEIDEGWIERHGDLDGLETMSLPPPRAPPRSLPAAAAPSSASLAAVPRAAAPLPYKPPELATCGAAGAPLRWASGAGQHEPAPLGAPPPRPMAAWATPPQSAGSVRSSQLGGPHAPGGAGGEWSGLSADGRSDGDGDDDDDGRSDLQPARGGVQRRAAPPPVGPPLSETDERVLAALARQKKRDAKLRKAAAARAKATGRTMPGIVALQAAGPRLPPHAPTLRVNSTGSAVQPGSISSALRAPGFARAGSGGLVSDIYPQSVASSFAGSPRSAPPSSPSPHVTRLGVIGPGRHLLASIPRAEAAWHSRRGSAPPG